MKVIFGLMTLLFWAFVTSAAYAVVCDSEICTESLERIQPVNGDTWIKLRGGVSTTGCTAQNGVIVLEKQNENYKDLLSLFLMAYSADMKVRVRMSANQAGACKVNYGYVDRTI